MKTVLNVDNKTAQLGLTIVEFSIVLLAISAFVIGIYAKASSVSDEARLYRALDESMLLLTKARAYKDNRGSYTGISITALNSAGYATDPISTGTGQNPWGLNYVLVAAGGNAQLTLTVGTASTAICTRLKDSLAKLVRNSAVTPTCASGDNPVLSLTVR